MAGVPFLLAQAQHQPKDLQQMTDEHEPGSWQSRTNIVSSSKENLWVKLGIIAVILLIVVIGFITSAPVVP